MKNTHDWELRPWLAITLVAAMSGTRAQADERLTLGAAAAWVLGAAGAGAIGNWTYDALFGDPRKPDCQGDVVVKEGEAKIKKPDGTVIMGKGKKVVLKGGDDDLGLGTVSDTIVMPDDYTLPLNLPPTYIMGETATYTLDTTNGNVSGTLDDMAYYADVSNPLFGGDGTLWSNEREVGFRLLKPVGGPPGEASVISLPVNISSLSLSTTDDPSTVASVEWEFVVSVAELGGEVFSSRVYIGQGSPALIQGDIPASAFLIGQGTASLTNYSSVFTIPVPAAIETLTFTVTQRNEGEAFLLATPTWQTEDALKSGSTGVAKLIGSGPLTPMSNNELKIVGALPSSFGILFVSGSSNPTPFKGGQLVPFPVALLLNATTDSLGDLDIPFSVDGLGSGVTAVLQYWFVDPGVSSGAAATNGLTLVTQ